MHGSAQDEGVCARALRTLLGAAAAGGSQRSTHMLLSVLEIHREAIHDLLLPPSTPSPPKLDVRLIGGEGGGVCTCQVSHSAQLNRCRMRWSCSALLQRRAHKRVRVRAAGSAWRLENCHVLTH